MRVLVVEPWLAGSHRQWAEGYRAASSHDIDLVGLPGVLWRWRLRGGALPLAEAIADHVERAGRRPDVVLVSGLVDVAQLRGLTVRTLGPTPVVVFQHESQLIYRLDSAPDQEAALRNWMSWAAADEVWFGSRYHLETLVAALPSYLAQLPDADHLPFLDEVVAAFRHVPVGVDLAPLLAGSSQLRPAQDAERPVTILWPHRWEPSKDPEAFLAALARVEAAGLDYRLVLAGESPAAGTTYGREVRARFDEQHGGRILAWGPLPADRYRELLGQADLVVSCARHELFGVAVVEAMAAGCVPLLPAALSYPELIPSRWHGSTLYEPGRFGSALVEAVAELSNRRRAVEGLASSLARYDWSQVAPHYDRRLSELVAGAGAGAAS